MRLEELSIGNLIDYFGKQKVIIKIQKEGIKYYLGCSDNKNDLVNCYNEIDAFIPIHITEEILLNNGFEKHNNLIFISINENKLTALECLNHFQIGLGGHHGVISLGEKKYLHEIQNLYFELAGHELNTKKIT